MSAHGIDDGTGSAELSSSSAGWSSEEASARTDKRSTAQRRLEAVLMNLCSVAWYADNALLPAVFREMSSDFGVGTTSLGFLVLLRGVSESLFAFPSGFLAEVLPRTQLLCLGILIWSAGLAACAFVGDWWSLCFCRFVNGVGLGISQPLLDSLVADMTHPSWRGIAFGSLSFFGNMGAVGGSLMATNLAPMTIMSMSGWRFSFLIVAACSALTGGLVFLLVGEPRISKGGSTKPSALALLRENMPKVCHLFKVKTFLVVVAQGAPGTIPWFAFNFFTMWLELNCFPNSTAAYIYMFFGLGCACAGVLGGILLDLVAKRFPDHGPPSLAMLSVGSGLPILACIFYGLPSGEHAGPSVETLYSCVFYMFGLLCAWCGTINQKVFADIVPQDLFTYVYAVDRAIEGTIAAAGSPAVGLLTDNVFHYNKTAARLHECDPGAAESLGLGIFTICLASWVLCIILYSFMQCTYPADRRRMLEEGLPGKGSPPAAARCESGGGGGGTSSDACDSYDDNPDWCDNPASESDDPELGGG